MRYSKSLPNCRLCKGSGWFIMRGWNSIEAMSTSEKCRCFCTLRYLAAPNTASTRQGAGTADPVDEIVAPSG